MNYNKAKAEAIQSSFDRIVLSWKSKEDILELYEQGYTPRAIYSIINEDLSPSWDSMTWSWKGVEKLVFEKGMSSGIFVSRLKKLVPYSSSHHEAFLAADEWIKSGHRTNMAPDQWESHRKARSLAGAKHVQGLRRTWQHYNPKNHESYYDGNTEEEKARLAFEHRRSKSPMTVEFWIRKGLDPDEARQWISENASKGGIAVCESLYSKCTSKLEQRVFNELSTKFELMQQLRIKNRFYDIACEKQKKIIEVDGTYWHCDPRLYSADYVHVSGRTAQEVWEHDQRKQSLAEEHGWSVYRVKELDLCKNYKQTLQLLENFLIGD